VVTNSCLGAKEFILKSDIAYVQNAFY